MQNARLDRPNKASLLIRTRRIRSVKFHGRHLLSRIIQRVCESQSGIEKNLNVSSVLRRVISGKRIFSRTAFRDLCANRFFRVNRFLFLVFPYFLFLCRAL